MKRFYRIIPLAAVAVLLGACATTPETIRELESARAAVSQVEASPRAGVAASHVSDARKALDRAESLAEDGADMEDIRHHAMVATKHAEIADQKILAAQAREDIEKGRAERQAVLIEAREREAQRRAEDAQQARQRADVLEQELKDLRAKKTDRGVVVTLGDVLFDTGASTLKAGAYRTIDRLANVLKQDNERTVLIEGHTDSVGSEEYNLALSQRRAEAVEAALYERGVSSQQIRTIGRGESAPVASNDNAGGRQQNRRVELIFRENSRVASDVD